MNHYQGPPGPSPIEVLRTTKCPRCGVEPGLHCLGVPRQNRPRRIRKANHIERIKAYLRQQERNKPVR
jgi:hypothetical protein